MKMYLLEETGESTRVFWSYEAADKAMTERLSLWTGLNALVTEINKNSFICYLNEKEFKVSIVEAEVEG